MVFLGDSITQHMREPSNWPVFQKYFASKYRAYPLGVGSAPCPLSTLYCVTSVPRSRAQCQCRGVWALLQSAFIDYDVPQRCTDLSLCCRTLWVTPQDAHYVRPSGAPHP